MDQNSWWWGHACTSLQSCPHLCQEGFWSPVKVQKKSQLVAKHFKWIQLFKWPVIHTLLQWKCTIGYKEMGKAKMWWLYWRIRSLTLWAKVTIDGALTIKTSIQDTIGRDTRGKELYAVMVSRRFRHLTTTSSQSASCICMHVWLSKQGHSNRFIYGKDLLVRIKTTSKIWPATNL